MVIVGLELITYGLAQKSTGLVNKVVSETNRKMRGNC
jgi:hypothetical protein